MSQIGFSPASLKEGRWYEYLVRFALGGAATDFHRLHQQPLRGIDRRSVSWRFASSSARARP